ncbi:hypothetical protein AOL_s00215g267 [Orbilia oligospora ATCC 24927]|uniref:Uncharacterized protein n=1 Tax=Arthrobotrys oligospora (strain ATCC 24927 / CBS 115.81 / DSM 1491) TaxID=756982 RepID=G1XTY8_ARTOA|nr:hypothetical protein AOL_s00215g267 [Orbilia oligospora ATCC 24927]EGX43531.1 hypothetical protein AOL_s00215g267 [Orbilia oligospora ATCC 24927]
MDTPKTSISAYGSLPDVDQDHVSLQARPVSLLEGLLRSQKLGSNVPLQQLTLNDAPWPGNAYVISYGDTSQVLTYQDKKVVLADYEGKQSQRWICHSKDGWLGFNSEPGETTLFMGYTGTDQKLVCQTSNHQAHEMFCIRKRPEEGFQFLTRSGKDYNFLWPLGKKEDGQLAVIRGSKDWWGFTRTI